MFRQFKCNILDWHKAAPIAFDGVSYIGICIHCHRKVLMDSGGSWFSVEW